MNFPSLKPGQVALIHAEVKTGIIIFPDGMRHLGTGSPWLVFDSLDDARQYARRKIIETPESECNLFNDYHQSIERHWNDDYWANAK